MCYRTLRSRFTIKRVAGQPAAIVFMVASLIAHGSAARAQSRPAMETGEVGGWFTQRPAEAWLRAAIVREATRLAQSPAPGPPQSDAPGPTWIARHSVIIGTLIGTAAGAAVGALASARQGFGHSPGVDLIGAGAVWGGLIGSAVRRSRLKYEPSQPDLFAVKRIIARAGVGERITVTGVNSQQITGEIQAIGRDQFTIVPRNQSAPVQVAYTDVRAIKARPLGVGAQIGIAVGVIGTFVVPALVCYGAGGCGGVS